MRNYLQALWRVLPDEAMVFLSSSITPTVSVNETLDVDRANQEAFMILMNRQYN